MFCADQLRLRCSAGNCADQLAAPQPILVSSVICADHCVGCHFFGDHTVVHTIVHSPWDEEAVITECKERILQLARSNLVDQTNVKAMHTMLVKTTNLEVEYNEEWTTWEELVPSFTIALAMCEQQEELDQQYKKQVNRLGIRPSHLLCMPAALD